MHFTIDSHRFLLALKQLNVRRNMYPYVQIRAVGEQITLLSSTWSSKHTAPYMQVDLSLPATLLEEGICAVSYRELMHAAKTLSGMLTVDLQEHVLVISSGEGLLRCQMSLRLLRHEFPATVFKEHEENERSTQEQSTRVQCDTCKEWHYSTIVNTYQVTQVMKQQLRVSRDLLASMCAQVAWVTEPEDDNRQALTGIRFELENDVLSLVTFDDHCVVIRKQTLAGAGSWTRPALIPAARLTQALHLLPKGEDILVETTATRYQLITGEEDAQSIEPFLQENGVSLSTDTMCVTLSLISSEFPNYQATIPSSPAIHVRCSTDALFHAVHAMMLPDQDVSHPIWFTSKSTTLLVEARRDDVALSAQYEIAVDQNLDRKIKTIMLYPWYVHSLLDSTTAQEISLAFTGPRSPVLFHSGGELDEYLISMSPMERLE